MSKVSTLVDCSEAEEVECLNDFIESIQAEMSVNCSLPFNIYNVCVSTKFPRASYFSIFLYSPQVCFYLLIAYGLQLSVHPPGIQSPPACSQHYSTEHGHQ